jgi:hypothetical protein
MPRRSDSYLEGLAEQEADRAVWHEDHPVEPEPPSPYLPGGRFFPWDSETMRRLDP